MEGLIFGILRYINATFLLVKTIQMTGMLLNVVHFLVHKNIEQRSLTGFITIPLN